MADDFIVQDFEIESHSAKDRFRLTFTSERGDVSQVTVRATHYGQFAEMVVSEIGLDQVPTIDPQSLRDRPLHRYDSFRVKPSPAGPILQLSLSFPDGTKGVLPLSFSDDDAALLIEMLKSGINRSG